MAGALSGRSTVARMGVPKPVTAVRNLAADLGVLEGLVRMRHARNELRRAREARELAPAILAAVAARATGELHVGWSTHRLLRTVTDMAVIAAGPAGGPPRALIKVAMTAVAAETLQREHSVLAALHADPRVAQVRAILPNVIADGEVAGRAFLVEVMLPGVPASRLLGGAPGAKRILTAAAGSISELHACTATAGVVEGALLERWVDHPVEVLRRHLAARRQGGRADRAIDRLAEALRAALEGRAVTQSWVHGDFGPTNVLMSARGAVITGIVDWESAASADLPLVDLVALLLSVRAQRRRRELGWVVRELLTGGNWSPLESALLDSAWSRLGGERVDSRALILLWWLRQVTANLTKSVRYTGGGLWGHWNVHPVLDALRRASVDAGGWR
jgi:aminoglycoside phosphotransferase (APT) family kinase protein